MEVSSVSSRTLSACRERIIGHANERTVAAESFAKFATVSNRRRAVSVKVVATPSSAPNRPLKTVATGSRRESDLQLASPSEANVQESAIPSGYDDITPMTREEKIKLFHIGFASFLPSAAVAAFGGLTPTLLTILVGGEQEAGTLSSCCAGGGALIALFATPIMSQLMDMYGRRVFAIVTALKSLAVALPMVAAGIIVHQNDGGMYGEVLTGGSLTAFKACVGLWFIATFFKTSTFSSQGVVAVGDLFNNAHHRAIGIGVYQACMTAGSFATLLGASLPLLSGSIAIVSIAVLGVIYNALFFPETCVPAASEDRSALLPRQSSSTTRRCFYAEVEGDVQKQQTKTLEGPPQQVTDGAGTSYKPRRIQVCVSPIRGLKIVREDPPAFVALLIICCFVFSEITAGDVLGFYLSKRLEFGPKDLSIMNIEVTIIQIVSSMLLVPVIGRFFTCSTLATFSSLLIAGSLVLIAIANAKFVVFIAMAPCALAIIAMPALVAVITRKAVTPEQVSLVMNSVMAINFALSAGGGVGGGILFSLLPPTVLFLTFIIAAAFTIPMFGMSVYLRVLLRREEVEECRSPSVAGAELA